MMLAWFSSSLRMKSSLPRMALTVPALAAKPLWKTTQASTFLKRAIFLRAPYGCAWFRRWCAPRPSPRRSFRGGDCGLDELRVVGQPEVVVAGQVDDFAAIVVAHRGLLIVQDAKLEMRALGAKLVENLGQMRKLGARSNFCHGDITYPRRIARQDDSQDLTGSETRLN